MKSRACKKTLSVFLSLLMMLTTLAVGFLPMAATAAVDGSTLVGRYFSTSSISYDAVSKTDGVEKVDGGFSYSHPLGMLFFNRGYARLTNENLFADVTRDTGVTFAFNYRPVENERYRHILSIGQNDAGNTRNHLFVSGARTQHHDNLLQVTWVNGNGNELINAYAADVPQVIGKEYNVVVTIDKDNGVEFYVDGEKKDTVYVGSDLNGQINNIRSFLDEVHNYKQNFVGRSRWNDPALMGYLSDLRIYKQAASDEDVYNMIIDMMTVTKQFNGDSALIGRYFSTSNVWYDAATGANGVSWVTGDYPVYKSDGWTYLNNSMYVRLINENLFANVTRDTGLTFAFDYVPSFSASEQFRHVLSIGQNAYDNGTANHLFISGAHTQHSSNLVQVTWVNGSGAELINAYADGVPQVQDKEYSVVVKIDKDEGVVFYVDGVKKNTVYVNSNLSGQIENIRSFLDEVHGYKQNYVGCSRWTADKKIDGLLRDLCIYKDTFTDDEVRAMLADRSAVPVDLNTPAFNAAAYHYSDHAEGGYNNVVWAPAQGTDPAINDFVKIDRSYFKFFVPSDIVLVYDGVSGHTPMSPITLETYAESWASTNGHNIYYYFIASRENGMVCANDWVGVIEGNNNQQWTWWPNINNNITNNMAFPGAYTDTLDNDNQYNTNTHRFWWNAMKYTGSGNTDSYYEKFSNISYRVDLKTNSSDYRDKTVTTANSNTYVLNYQPVYNVLPAADAVNSGALGTDAWMYTESSLAQAKIAMRRLTLCNPNLYDYEFRGTDNASAWCAAAIKQAKADYDAINLVKKTATVHISAGTGTTITVTNNGAPVTDGATVNYGDTLTVSAAAQDAYDQHTPAVTISDDTNTASTLVNRPEITVSTDALALNTYTLTFDANGGTLTGNDSGVTATYTQPLPAAIAATRDGYTFQRYYYTGGSADYTYYDQNLANTHGNYDVKGDITVFAQWAPVNYTLTFIPNGCTIDASALDNFGSTYTIEDVKTLPTAVAPVGYHFDGWTVSSSNAGEANGWGSEKIAANASVAGKWGNVTLTATYAPNTDTAYTVEYYEMGTDGAYPAAATRTVNGSGTTGETASADTAAPTGFTFDSDNVNNVTSASIAADGSTVLKVYLKRNQYTVHVTLGEGVSLNVTNGAKYFYGETVTFTATAATGYNIDSLNMTVNGASAANGVSVTVTDDITVAVDTLEKQKFTVTVAAGEGTEISGVSTQEYVYGTQLTVSASAQEGYNAAGLKLKAAGNVVTNPYTFTVTGPITISTDDLHKLTFTVSKNEGAGTSITGDGSYEWGSEVTVSAAALEGYTGDLVLKVDNEVVSNPYTFTVTENVTVATEPRTAIIYYTVVFNNYDNTKLYETSVAVGGAAEFAGSDPVKPDEGAHSFTFAGWDKSLENITETTVFTAQFNTVHSFTKQGYDANGHYMQCAECDLIDESTRAVHILSTVTDREATCKTEGLAHEACSACAYATEPVSVGVNENNHKNIETAAAVPETCCTVGYTAGKVCADCGVYTEGHEEIAADPVNGHLYPEAWTPADGTHTKTCTREGCTDAIANHTISAPCNGTATCANKAVCTVCGGEYGALDPANHENLQTVALIEATCTEPGNNAYYYCSACDKSFTDAAGTVAATDDDIVIPASGHSWSVSWAWDDTVTPPTAAATFVCANDAAHNTTVEAAVFEIASSAAHCGEQGSVTYRASYTMDGVTYTTEGGSDKTVTTESLPHLWAVDSWNWNDDHTAVTLNLICTRDNGHTHQIADIPAAEETVSEADCENDKVVKYTAAAEYDGYSFASATDEITLADTALGHSYEFVNWSWAEDYASATAYFRCTRENCGHTAEITDITIDTATVRAADCEYDQIVKYTANVELALQKGAEVTAFTDTTDEITLAGTKTAHSWGEISYTWNGTESVTAKRVCENYASHVEEETVSADYAVTTAPTYTDKGEGTYTATFTNSAFEAQTKKEEVASLKEQIEAALSESGSGVGDIDTLIETANKIVNGEDPYTAPYEESYIDALSGKLAEFDANKNDPEKAETLADALNTIKELVDTHEDYIVYTVTYILNGGAAQNKTSFVRTDAAFTLVNPTKAGYVFSGWTGTGISDAAMTVTVNPADAENKTFTATWAIDNTEAENAISNAATLIADADDLYEDAYSEALAGLVQQLEDALAADPQDPEAIRGLIDAVNDKIAEKDGYKHKFTVNAGYKEGYAPTCTLAGVTLMKCENCDKIKEVTAKALGHDWGEWQVITPADYGVDGEARRYCSRCDAFESKTLTLSAEYDRQIRFNTVSKMHYVIELDDGYAVYNTNTILWYSAAALKFHVYTYTNANFDGYAVYINGKEATPDENGSYTLPAGSTYDTVTFGARPTATDGGSQQSGSGVCAYCGQVHPNTLWGRIIALFHAILAFFKNLFNR